MSFGSSADSPTLDALVVGAGFAGLAAAERLVAAGLRIRVLEASDRVGGRAFTDYRLGAGVPLELGAQMVHGRHVVTHAWLERYGLTARPLRLNQHSRIVLERRVGRYPWFAFPFHPVVGTRATVDAFSRIPRELDTYTGEDRSLATFLEERHVSAPARALVKLLHSHSYATDPDVLGVRGPGEDGRRSSEPYGFRNFQVVEGYSELAHRVASRLGDRILRNTPVTEIRRSPHGVSVRARAGDSGEELELHAPAVVVTVPLGVLRSGSIAFDPPLPDRRRAAINRIGFGDAYALQLRVHGGTMTERLGDFGVLWGGTHTSFRRPRLGTGADSGFVTAFTVGREARRRAALPDDALLDATLAEWESVVPSGVTLGKVDGFEVHRWTTDPWVRGAYSFLPTNVRIEEREELARPLDDQLFWAGEATDIHGEPATVAGALRTGGRAAEELLAARARPAGGPRS